MDPGSRRHSPPRPGIRTKAGCRRWGVGGGFCSLRASKRAWYGSAKQETDFPTPHPLHPTSRRSRLSGPMPRHYPTVLSPRITPPPLGEGWGGGCWRCKSQMPGAVVYPIYTPPPTLHILAMSTTVTHTKSILHGGFITITIQPIFVILYPCTPWLPGIR